MSSNSQQDPDETLEIGNEQPSDSITGHAQSPSQQAVQPVPANLHAQPSPLHSSSSPSSSTSSHSQRSASESPNEEAHQFSLPTLSMQAPNPSKPKTHLSADRKPSGSQERSPPEALHQSTSANLSSQAPSTSKTEMQPSVDSAPFASGNPHTTSQQFSSAIQVSSPSKSVTQSSPSSSVAGAHMQPQQSPKQNASAASTGSEADGEAVPQSPSSQLAAQQRGDSNLAPNVSSQSLNGSPSCMNSQESAALGKASPVPRKPWQRNDVTQHAASASQSASASASLPFWQRQDRAADAASHQPTAVPFWLRKDASHTDAASADDTASVQSEPAPVPFWQRGSTSTTRDASDAASDIGTSTSVPSVWQRSVSDVYKGAPNMTASHSGSAPVPFWQSGDRRTDTFIPHSAAAASQHSSRSSTDSGVSAPAHMPFWQNKHPPVNSAASAPIAVPFWQTRQTGTAAPQLTSQASSNSVASSSTGPGSDYNPRVLTAQRALFEAQGSTPSTSRAPQLSHLGSANPAVASSSPASNSQASDIAKLQAQAMRRSGVLRRHVGDSRAGSSLGSPTGSVASVATSAWPDTPRSRR